MSVTCIFTRKNLIKALSNNYYESTRLIRVFVSIGPPPVPPSPLRSHQRNPSSGGRGSDGSGGRPIKILFVEEMTKIVSDTFPDLWQLGRAYFSGSLFQGVMLTEKQQQLARNCGVNQSRFEVNQKYLFSILLLQYCLKFSAQLKILHYLV